MSTPLACGCPPLALAVQVVFVVVFIGAMFILAQQLFGFVMGQFATPGDAVLTLLLMMIGDVDPVYREMTAVDRTFGIIYFTIFVMLFLFVLTSLSFAAFALDDISDRVTIVLTLLLTTVAYKLVVASSLRQLSYLTLLDAYTLFSLLILCAVFTGDVVLQEAYHGVIGPLVATLWASGSAAYAIRCVSVMLRHRDAYSA